jgi:hypothetical protein
MGRAANPIAWTSALMPDDISEAQRLRTQAERCLRLAKGPIDRDMAESLHKLGTDYLAQANAIERGWGQQQQRGNQPPPPLPEHGQQPALQQQQVQPEDEGDK